MSLFVGIVGSLSKSRSNTLQQMQEKEENLTEDIINLPLDEIGDGFPLFPGDESEMSHHTSCGRFR